jgi:hypothetical protein
MQTLRRRLITLEYKIMRGTAASTSPKPGTPPSPPDDVLAWPVATGSASHAGEVSAALANGTRASAEPLENGFSS